ncbi:ligand-binding sensor domain-containing protein [Spirosoma pollinicola]|nr:sensor histidine kinase [Spirosoma pollinicola]
MRLASFFRLFLLFSWTCIGSQTVYAQPVNLPLEFQHIQESQGLSYNVINSLLQDHDGYLWIGTYEGLNRFDGSHFTVFKASHRAGSLPNNIVHDLCQDKANDLWLATDDGISRRDSRTGQFSAIRLVGTENLGRCMNILCDRKGRIWFSSLNKGLFRLDPATGQITQFKNDPAKPATLSGDYISKNGIVEDPQRDGLWLTTEQNGLNYLDINTGKFFNHKNNPEQLPVFRLHDTSALVLDGTDKLLFSDNTDQRILVYDLVHKTITNSISLTSQTGRSAFPVGTIFVDRKHNLWISSWTYTMFTAEAGSYKVREFFHDVARRTSIAGDFFWAGWQQNDGTIWLGTVNGISYTNPGNAFYQIHDLARMHPSLAHKQGLTSFLEDEVGNWWFFSVDQELLKYESASGQLTVYSLPLPMRQTVWSGQTNLLPGLNPDEIYIRQGKSVSIFNRRTRTFTPFPLPPSLFSHAADLRSMVRQGDWLWLFGTSDVIFRCYLPSGRWQTYPLPFGETKKYRVYSAGLDKTGRLWADVRDKGLIWFSAGQQRFVPFPVQQAGSGYADHLPFTTDAENRLWIPASGQGLLEVDPKRGTSRLWTDQDGLSTNECKAVCADAYGQIWMASLNKFSIINLARSSVQNTTLALNESNIGYTNYMFALRNGNLITTLKNYVVEFMPHRINRQIAPASVLISTLTLPDTTMLVQAHSPAIRLGVSATNFSISYAVLNRVQQHYVYFYTLDGYDDHWVKADARTVANYTKIPGGDYTFRVKAVAGKTETGETTLAVHIDTAFYNTRWFRMALLALLLGLTYWLYLYRTRQTAQLHHFQIQTTRLERDKAQIQYQNLINHLNPHFLFNSLTSLNSLIITKPKDASQFLRKLSTIYRYILQNKDKELVSLQDELTFAQNYIDLQAARFGSDLQISINVDAAYLTHRIVPVTIQNLLENAIKHNILDEESPLYIRIFTENNTLFVANTLQKKDFVETSNKQGLASLKSLYGYLSGREISITQTDTEFTVAVPLL